MQLLENQLLSADIIKIWKDEARKIHAHREEK